MYNPIMKAAIFDFDDTLVDTEDFFFNQLHNTLEKVYGKDYDRKYLEKAKAFYHNNDPFEKIFEETFGENHIEIINKYREKAQYAAYKARPGMLAYVKTLADQNIKLFILSNRTIMIKHRLIQAGYDPGMFIIYEAEKKKPHHLAYYKVIKLLKNEGITEETTIFIGNHPDDYNALPDNYKNKSTFIAVPKNNGIKKIFLSYSENKLENIYIYDDLSELSKING